MNENAVTSITEKPEIKELFLTQLIRGKYQPRREFDLISLQELAQTIRRDGILQYLLVRPIVDQNNIYEIIAGERRWRAAQLAGLEKVPCLVSSYTNEAAARISLIENTARQNLSPIEEAEGIEKLVAEFDYTHEEVASVLGKPRTQITNLLRLLKLDPRVRLLITNGDLTESHGKTLAGISKYDQFNYAKDTVIKKWSVHKLEKAIKNQLPEPTNKVNHQQSPKTKDAHIQLLERKLSDYLGAHVEFDLDDTTQQKGHVKIRFSTLDELDGIFQRVGYSDE